MRQIFIFLSIALGIFLIDRGLKDLFVEGYEWYSNCISLELHFNKGVAFSMLSSLGESLKYLHLLLVIAILLYLVVSKFIKKYPLSTGILTGAALGNLYDRFVYGGVVDYVSWHCWFDFAIFNFADVMIDVAVLMFLYIIYKEEKKDAR